MAVSDPRLLAAKVLERVDREHVYAHTAFDREARRSSLSPREVALAHEMVFGVLRNRRLLEHALPTERPLKDAHPQVQRFLLIAAYEILFMDSVPAEMSVNRAVELIKRRRGRRAAGFANAVLRKLAADPHVDLPRDPVRRLGIERSLPDWLARRLVERHGYAVADEIAAGLGGVPPVVLRTNLRRISREELMDRIVRTHPGAEVEPGRWTSSAVRVKGMANPVTSPLHREGLFSVQDEGSQLVSILANPRPGERILDAAAGSGGKALHLYDLAGTPIDAVDINHMKILELRERAAFAGAEIRTKVMDLTSQRPEGEYDLVLLDAPCTGLGVLRRNPEARWRLREQDVERFASIQAAMLRNVAGAVAPGGRLVYVVCTFTEEETHGQVESFLEERNDFALEPRPDHMPEELFEGDFLRLYPHAHDTDGFFAAVLRRKGG